ncbi:hypothetical protein Tsubulata_040960 [Turnera subulata]|uniref:R13L1/DRL21-like LRR repeat region domain-containing protein n=1 Tax=Turnera subulata TaxID=218843 RepID=A0A9Q0FHN7_9ROSI|nr:hypothetical protein Tsubulata_040960 [Turnera subulata]
MPVGMGKLVKLQKLTDFIVGEQQRGSGLGELGELRNLQGWLTLENLENDVNEGDALRANLKDKKGLRELEYCWKNNYGSVDASLLLQLLRPHVNVERIDITGFSGTSLPDWLGDSSYSKLVSLVLHGGKHCTHLPPVGQLPFLEILWIIGFDSVVSVGAEFYGGGSGKSSTQQQPFQSLKKLNFKVMARWEEWISNDDGRQGSRRRAFPILERLELTLCGELRRVNHMFLPSVVELRILLAFQLKTSMLRIVTSMF